jgi:ABC-type sulfate transport system permease component
MPIFLRSASVMGDILRWATSVGTIGAGLILAARVRPRITGWAFVVLSIYRWLIWKGKI